MFKKCPRCERELLDYFIMVYDVCDRCHNEEVKEHHEWMEKKFIAKEEELKRGRK